MGKFFAILERLYYLVYTCAWLGLTDWLEKSGTFERIFKRPMAYWHGIVILLFFVALSIVLPDIVNSDIGSCPAVPVCRLQAWAQVDTAIRSLLMFCVAVYSLLYIITL